MRLLRHVLILSLVFAPAAAFAKEEKTQRERTTRGPGEGGGGDPMAQQFVHMGKQLAQFFKTNPYKVALPFEAEKFHAEIERIDQSVKDETARDLVEFTDEDLVDQHGVPKDAIFDLQTRSIAVNRPIWRVSSNEDRLILITMEVMGLIDSRQARYETASALVRGRAAVILSIPVDNDGSFKKPGMRIVGQDADQFGRINDYEVLIDAGVIGNDDEASLRFARFLDTPSADAEWSALLEKARVMRRPAYMLVTGPGGDRAVILSFYRTAYKDGKHGAGSYWLQLYKARQVYDGPCVGEALELPARDRIKNCFLNTDNYVSHDLLNGVKQGQAENSETPEQVLALLTRELKSELLGFFALEKNLLAQAVRSNFLMDYSSLVADPAHTDIVAQTFRTIVWRATAGAHGLTPSLTGPFSEAKFWIQTEKKNPADVRMFKAMEALARAKLGFVPHNVSCNLPAKGWPEEGGAVLIPLERLRVYRAAKACESAPTTHFPRFEKELFEAMVKEGFHYDYKAATWHRDAVTNGVRP